MKNITEVKEQPTLAQCQERLEQISVHRSQMVSDRISLDRRLESARKEAGRRYLDGDRTALQEASAITAELQAIESALMALDEDHALTEIESQRAKARGLREEAQQKASELERLNQETAKLLAELSKLEGVSFTTSILSSQPVLGSRGMMSDPLTSNAPDPWLAVFELRVNNPSGELAHVPRSRGMRTEIRKLEAEAASIEQKLIPRATRSNCPPNPTFAEQSQMVVFTPEEIRHGAQH